MKRIVVCFDGTWNKPADEALAADQRIETNVRRFYESIQDQGADGARQVKWYDEGVGTQWYDRYLGAAIGTGLEFNIIQGYEFLAKAYENGDEVYVIGFSRGAYTARSLVGMIRNCGLIEPKHLALRAAVAYGIYRTRDDNADSLTAKWFRAAFSRQIRIKFIGVWDTVGALGIPGDVFKDVNMKFYEFHDTKLSGIVENAYQAIAVDEHRQDYDVCLWSPETAAAQRIEQRWFLGAHCDVGGGYKDRRLSDMALRWMQDKAIALGLGIDPVAVSPQNFLGEHTDSYAQFLGGVYARKNARHYRAMLGTKFGNETIDESVTRRRKEDREYEPQNNGLPKMT
jgi:uncharacterized protein (DUF2235 family)